MPRPVFEWLSGPGMAHAGSDSAAQGLLSDSPLVELIAYAFNRAFSGTLALDRAAGGSVKIGFEKGRIVALHALEHMAASLRRALEASLPPDALGFAEQHALRKGSDLLTAVEELMLLPQESLALVRRELVCSHVVKLCVEPADTRYEFRAGISELDGAVQLAEPMDPLSLLVTCILEDTVIERARRSIDAFQHVLLTLRPGASIDRQRLNAVNRRWLEQLDRAPVSFAGLVRAKPQEHNQLTAFVYALLITGLAEVKTAPSEAARPMHNSRVPRSISSEAVRAIPSAPRPPSGFPQSARSDARRVSTPAASPKAGSDRPLGRGSVAPGPHAVGAQTSSRPPARVPSDSGLSSRNQVQRECDAESRVAQAWMLGEADSAHLAKSREFTSKVLKLFPHNPRIRYCFARLQKRAHEYDSAIEEFARVVELDPNHADAKQELCLLLEWRRKRRRAEKPV